MEKTFNHMAEAVAHATGRPWAFAICVASVALWAVSGPVFHFSETWQLVINTGGVPDPEHPEPRWCHKQNWMN